MITEVEPKEEEDDEDEDDFLNGKVRRFNELQLSSVTGINKSYHCD